MRRIGTRFSKWWWEYEGLDLEGTWAAAEAEVEGDQRRWKDILGSIRELSWKE